MKRTLRLILLMLCAGIASAQYSRPGSSSAQFLKIGVSPRGSAMSNAYIAAVDGAEGTHYNAASLAWIPGSDVAFDHTIWFAGISHDYGAAAHTFGDVGTFAVSVTALQTDLMPVRTPLQPNGTGETFSAGSYRAALSYARYLTDRVSLGITFSYIYEKLYSDFTASAFAGDIAALYVSGWRGFRFAMMISNFGSDVKFVNESYPLPTAFTFGLSLYAIDGDDHKVLASFSATKPNEGKPLGAVGAEYAFRQFLFLRGGYQLYHEVATYSFGAGVRQDIFSTDVRFDYAYSDFGQLGAAHRFGLGIGF